MGARQVSSVRESFVARFGEDQAKAIEDAAEMHKNGVHDNPGSDYFKWAILIAIGHECLSRFATSHGITVAEEDVRTWALEEGDLGSHDGDFDYLAAAVGAYKGWVREEEPV